MQLLGRGSKAAAVKQAKVAKEAAKEARLALSPRSQQLKQAALAAEAQRQAELAQMWQGGHWHSMVIRSLPLLVADGH